MLMIGRAVKLVGVASDKITTAAVLDEDGDTFLDAEEVIYQSIYFSQCLGYASRFSDTISRGYLVTLQRPLPSLAGTSPPRRPRRRRISMQRSRALGKAKKVRSITITTTQKNWEKKSIIIKLPGSLAPA